MLRHSNILIQNSGFQYIFGFKMIGCIIIFVFWSYVLVFSFVAANICKCQPTTWHTPLDCMCCHFIVSWTQNRFSFIFVIGETLIMYVDALLPHYLIPKLKLHLYLFLPIFNQHPSFKPLTPTSLGLRQLLLLLYPYLRPYLAHGITYGTRGKGPYSLVILPNNKKLAKK